MTQALPKRTYTRSESAAAGWLVLLASLLGLAGLFLASQVSLGVAVVGFGCLVAILARMAQARAQHDELLRMLWEARLDTPRQGAIDS